MPGDETVVEEPAAESDGGIPSPSEDTEPGDSGTSSTPTLQAHRHTEVLVK